MTGPDRVQTIAPDAHAVLAPNPSPMTLDGTNTWVLGGPDGCVVIDPGPDLAAHRARVLSLCGAEVAAVWLTHRHLDHSEGAAALAAEAGCGVRAADPEWRRDGRGGGTLQDGVVVETGGVRLEAVATPGHTSDSMSVLVSRGDEAWLLSGDTVLGRGSTVITHPDGDLGAYLASLDRLSALVGQRDVSKILPGHGPVVERPSRLLEDYRRHRLERLEQVRAALAAGDQDAAAVVRRVYADVDRSVWPAAEQSVRAQLDYLTGQARTGST